MELEQYLEMVATQIDSLIDRSFGNTWSDLDRASTHLLVAGGKRLRPAVVMLSADAINHGSSSDILPAALSLELIHTFTLVHDDIMDDDTMRRGVPTVHTKWDIPTGILAGDVLYARAFEFLCLAMASEKAKIRAVSMLARACAEICAGQHLDMSFEKRDDVTEDEYFEMAKKKTGMLYAAAAGIGAILAGGTPYQAKNLYQFGLNTGIAFQIQDDLIDLLTSSEKSGKDRASDLRDGKQTLIWIRAREKGIDLSKYKRDLSDADIEEVISILDKVGVIADVKKAATDLVNESNRLLNTLPQSPERELLKDIGKFFVTRSF
ncbi:MAG: polyprenyl synthetase family protein [Methanoregulaceae archaeon]|jgi:geranylgeranyl diphosphate synthase type I